MTQAWAVAIGGALGSLARWLLAARVQAWLGRDFPWATLAVNVAGSFAMGLLAALLVERMALGPIGRAGLLVGFLGAFTTFSTFAFDTVGLVENALGWRALVNVAANVGACVAALWFGLLLARTTWG